MRTGRSTRFSSAAAGVRRRERSEMDEELKVGTALFDVGTIFVEVGRFGGPVVARTKPMGLASVDLGGTLSVEVDEYMFEDDWPDLPPYGSVGMYKLLLTKTRDFLARCMVLGQVQPIYDGPKTDEGWENFNKAADERGEDFFHITPDKSVVALMDRNHEEYEVGKGLQTLLGIMKKMGANTIGEIVEKAEEEKKKDDEK
jgi:hypothetical protein